MTPGGAPPGAISMGEGRVDVPEPPGARAGGRSPPRERRRGRRESDLALLSGCADGLSSDAVSPEAIVGDVVEVLRLMGCPAALIAWGGEESRPRILAAYGLDLPPRAPLGDDLLRYARALDGGPPAGPTPPPIGPVAARLGAHAHIVPLVRGGALRGILAAVRSPEVPGAERHEAASFRLLGHLAAAALDAAERTLRETSHFHAGHFALLRVLGRELARARALEVPCSFVRVRLAGVGRLNAAAGLEAGDAAFRAVREAIEAEVPEARGLDLVGRHLADSWAVVLPGYARAEAEVLADTVARAARARLAAALPASCPAVSVETAVATVPDDGRHVTEIVRKVASLESAGQ